MSETREYVITRRNGDSFVVLYDAADQEVIDRNAWSASCDRQGRFRYASGKRGPDWNTRYLHRELMHLAFGDGLEVDHKNGDRLDNRRRNLRIVTHAQNMRAYREPTGVLGIRGVSRHSKGLYRARIHIDGREILGGYFKTVEEAAARAAELHAQRLAETFQDAA